VIYLYLFICSQNSEREQSEEPPSYDALHIRCIRAEEELDKALADLRETRDAFQRQRIEIIGLKQASMSSLTALRQASVLISSVMGNMEEVVL
jgi:hypothetical protein